MEETIIHSPYENKLWFQFLRRFSILLSLKTTVVTIFCYYAGFQIALMYRFPLPDIAGLWCAISGIVVTQVFIHESLNVGGLRILGSFIGALISFVASDVFGYHLLSLAISIFFIGAITAYFKIQDALRLANLTATIIILVGIVTPTIPAWLNSTSRFIESALGTFIAIAITALFHPLRKKLGLLQH